MESVDAMTRLQIRDPTKIQLFSAQTPNGIKVAACLEELNEVNYMYAGISNWFNEQLALNIFKHSHSYPHSHSNPPHTDTHYS